MDFSQVKVITIPEGNVKQIEQAGVILWKIPEKILPDEYQQVDYIRSTDDGGQWIDTGVPGENSNLRIDISYMWDVVPSGTSYQNIISAYVNEASNCTRILQYGANTTYVDLNIRANRSVRYNGARVAGTKYNESLTRTYYDVNGVRLTITEFAAGSSNNQNLHLFSSSGHSAFAKSLRLYSCKLYNGDTIIRDFVPCYRRADGVAGLYDLENGVFYTNGGTGTFVLGPAVVPSHYQQVSYIESTGTQWINTGVTGDENTGFEIQFYSNDAFGVSGYGTMFGARQRSGTGQFYLTSYGTTSGGGQLRWGTSTTNNLYMAKQEIMSVSLIGTTFTRNDGTTINIAQPSAFTTPRAISIFALNENGTITQYGKLRLYSLKLYNGNALTRNYVPCYRKSDDVVGVYDLVQGEFKTNAGTGTFIVGPDV